MYWEVIGNHMWRVYIAGQFYPTPPPPPPYGSNWGHKIVALEFCLISLLLLLLYLQNVLRGIGKAYVESLNSWSVLPPGPPLWVKLGS